MSTEYANQDRPILSPARRAQRCLLCLVVCVVALLGGAALLDPEHVKNERKEATVAVIAAMVGAPQATKAP